LSAPTRRARRSAATLPIRRSQRSSTTLGHADRAGVGALADHGRSWPHRCCVHPGVPRTMCSLSPNRDENRTARRLCLTNDNVLFSMIFAFGRGKGQVQPMVGRRKHQNHPSFRPAPQGLTRPETTFLRDMDNCHRAGH